MFDALVDLQTHKWKASAVIDGGCVVDKGIYTHNRCFRPLGQSKADAPTHPLVPYTAHIELAGDAAGIEVRSDFAWIRAHCAVGGDDTVLVDWEPPAFNTKAARAARAPRVRVEGEAPAIQPDDARLDGPYVLALLALLPGALFKAYDTCFKIVSHVWYHAHGDETRTALIEACAPHVGTERGSTPWIDWKIRETEKKITQGNFAPTLRWLETEAAREHPEAYEAVHHKHHPLSRMDQGLQDVKLSQPVRADVDSPVVTSIGDMQVAECYRAPRVKDISIDVDTALLMAAMGAGKTVMLGRYLADLAKLKPSPRVIIVSPRCSFGRKMYGDLASVGFQLYSDRDCNPATAKRLIIQTESLHRMHGHTVLADAKRLDAESLARWHARMGQAVVADKVDVAADYVLILDESEAICAQMNSIETHKGNHVTNHEVLEYLIKGASRAVIMDAHMTARSTDLVLALRPAREATDQHAARAAPKLIVNSNQHVKRSVTVLNDYAPMKLNKATDKYERSSTTVVNDIGLDECIEAALAAGEKCVFYSSSKTSALSTYAKLKDRYKVKVYHGESTPEEKKELEDVDTHWRGIDLLIYTSTITVGVSFSGQYFNRLFAYFTASTVCPRDNLQALGRVRSYTVDNLTCVFQPKCIPPPTVTMEETRHYLSRREGLLIDGSSKSTRWDKVPEWGDATTSTTCAR